MLRVVQQLNNKLKELEREVRLLSATGTERRKYPVGSSSADSRIWCTVIERATLLSSSGVAYRWKYKLQRIQLTDSDTIELVDGDETFAGWPDVYALNEMEFSNQAQNVGYQTTGVNQASPYPAGFKLEPIGGGSGSTPSVTVPCYARMMSRPDGSRVWVFSVANADNGTCE